MGRKRTMNYRDFRNDFDESDERRKKEDEEGGDEEEEEEDDEEGDDEEGDGDDEAAEGDDAAGDGDDDDGDAPPKKAKKKAKPKVEKPKRVKKPRAGKVVRMRVVWGVYNNSNQRVASFDYSKREDAEADAKKRAEDKKQTFFVQPVKEAIEEKKEEK